MSSLLLQFLTASLAINLALFLIAYRLQSDKLTDASYAVSFLALAALGYARAATHNIYSLTLWLLVTLWALRLGMFLVIRVRKMTKDRRFDGIRSNFLMFGRFWLAQAVTVWLLMLSTALAQQHGGELTVLAMTGLAVWLIGLLVETAADLQKFKFNANKDNRGKWIDTGLWQYARHPNYFGEILVWVGIYFYCVDALPDWQKLLGLISPIVIIILLRYVSGVPILEQSADKRWGAIPEYRAYKARTRLLVPLP